MAQRFFVQHQIDARRLGQGVTGQVVMRRTEPAGGNHQSGALHGDAQGGNVVVEIVCDGGVEPDRDTQLRKPPRQPLAVRVQVLSAGHLTADREDFRFHEDVLP